MPPRKRSARMSAASTPDHPKRQRNEVEHSGGGGRTGSFSALVDPTVPPHTLLLGTQPSVKSIDNGWYFGSDTNSFWPIAGEALGFRRGFHAKERADGDVVPSIAKSLTPGLTVVQYDQATRLLTAAGYALWDILESSERQGSLDSSIKKPRPAPIEDFVTHHPSIEQIVFVTGKGSADLFRKHFGGWLASGKFRLHDSAVEVFGKAIAASPSSEERHGGPSSPIQLVIPPSVSPAHATMHFELKRDAWLEQVYWREQQKKTAGAKEMGKSNQGKRAVKL